MMETYKQLKTKIEYVELFISVTFAQGTHKSPHVSP